MCKIYYYAIVILGPRWKATRWLAFTQQVSQHLSLFGHHPSWCMLPSRQWLNCLLTYIGNKFKPVNITIAQTTSTFQFQRSPLDPPMLIQKLMPLKVFYRTFEITSTDCFVACFSRERRKKMLQNNNFYLIHLTWNRTTILQQCLGFWFNRKRIKLWEEKLTITNAVSLQIHHQIHWMLYANSPFNEFHCLSKYFLRR